MNLALELALNENDLIVDLIDLKLLNSKKTLLINSYSQFTSDLLDLLRRSDSHNIIDTLNSEQRLITIYFYLNTYITSEMIVKRWLKEVNLNNNLQTQVHNLIQNARFVRYEDDYVETRINSFINSIFEKASNIPSQLSDNQLSEGANTIPILNLKQLDLAVGTLMKHPSIVWLFSDSLNQNIQVAKNSVPQANIAEVRELSVVLIDHDSIITGLTVSYTLFIQVIANDNIELIESLCSYFPLGIRDKVTVAFALTQSPILKLLLSKHYDKIELYGFNNQGRLFMVKSNLSILECFTNEAQEFLPYFLKFKRNNYITFKSTFQI